MSTKTFHCPHCGGKNQVDIDLYGIQDGELYHQTEDCCECKQPFVASVRARFEFGTGKIEWQS